MIETNQEALLEAIPSHMMSGIRRYVDDREPVGGFLEAIITNDLQGAVGRADHINQRLIFEYVSWFYNYEPHNCHGSTEIYNRWLEGDE